MIAQPLYTLLQSGTPFIWTAAQQQASETLRTALTENVLLAYPQFDLPFIVATDASDVGIAAVLSQVIDGQERPIAFYTQKPSAM